VKVPSGNKGERPRKQQKTTHVPRDAGGITANVPIETSTSVHAISQVETCTRGRGRGRGRGGSSRRRNNAARIDVTTREGTYLGSVITNDFLTTTGGGHGIKGKLGVSHMLLMS